MTLSHLDKEKKLPTCLHTNLFSVYLNHFFHSNSTSNFTIIFDVFDCVFLRISETPLIPIWLKS